MAGGRACREIPKCAPLAGIVLANSGIDLRRQRVLEFLGEVEDADLIDARCGIGMK